MKNIDKLRRFIQDVTLAVDEVGDEEPKIVARCRPLLAELVAKDDWLPDEFATPDPDRYQQFLLYCDPSERFSVVSFVWGPGQSTPVHDHTVWGLIGMLRGSEDSTNYELAPNGTGLVKTDVMQLKPGDVTAVSPTVGDIHAVANAHADRPSISVHIYGANIGAVRRHIYEEKTGDTSLLVTGYTNSQIPNIWDRSQDVRAAAS